MPEMAESNEGLRVVLFGKTGAGKSSVGNTILQRQAFKAEKSAISVTKEVKEESGTVFGLPVTVYDTPGLCDTHLKEQEIQQKYQNIFQKCDSVLCAFIIVIKADRFTEEERKTVEMIEKLLGLNRMQKTWILFTRGDELEEENKTIKQFINESEPLKKLVQKYDDRYDVFNNKKRGHIEQVQRLFANILKKFHQNIVKGTLKRKPAVEGKQKPKRSPDRRIVLLGKSGVGKSAAGNIILRQRAFKSMRRMTSVTRECSEARATVSDRYVSVVDTPGFFDTNIKFEELIREIAKSIYTSSLGPHAFLIVLSAAERFTELEQKIPQMIEMLFGEEVLKYSIILFTHGDQLEGESMEDVIGESKELRDLINQCGGGYHVFNNKDNNDVQQVNDLLQKIDTMIEQNGGGHYSNQMFEDAQKFQQEEKEERLRQEELKKQEQEKNRQEEIERVRRETEEKTKGECEAKLKSGGEKRQKPEETGSGFNNFLSKYWKQIISAVVVGGLLGAGFGAKVAGAGIIIVLAGGVAGGVAGSVAGGVAGGVAGSVAGGVVGGVAGSVVGGVVGGVGAAIYEMF